MLLADLLVFYHRDLLVQFEHSIQGSFDPLLEVQERGSALVGRALATFAIKPGLILLRPNQKLTLR